MKNRIATSIASNVGTCTPKCQHYPELWPILSLADQIFVRKWESLKMWPLPAVMLVCLPTPSPASWLSVGMLDDVS